VAAIDQIPVGMLGRFRGFCNLGIKNAIVCEAGQQQLRIQQFTDVLGVERMFGVGRIGKNEIVALGVFFQKGKHFGMDDAVTLESCGIAVLADDLDRLVAFVDESTGAGAAAERFQT